MKPMVIVALGLGLWKREQFNLRRDQVDFARNVIVAAKTKGRKNREIPIDVLDPRVRAILLKLCRGKKPDDYVFTNPDTKTAFTDVKRSFTPPVGWRRFKTSGGTIYVPLSVRAWPWLGTRRSQ